MKNFQLLDIFLLFFNYRFFIDIELKKIYF